MGQNYQQNVLFSNNTEHVTRLEDMLAQEKKKVRQLMESLDQLGAATTNIKRSPPKVSLLNPRWR